MLTLRALLFRVVVSSVLLWTGVITAKETGSFIEYWELTGNVALEGRYFPEKPRLSAQPYLTFATAFEPELYLEWDDGTQSLTLAPFFRFDSHDNQRTHFDIRELMWQWVGDAIELRAGVGKVFWGVTEGVHLVDIINQTDLVESPDGEDKLGQPMVNLDFVEDWGTLSLFLLPRTRLRTFPGPSGRLSTQPRVATDQVRFDSGAGRGHVDVAGRWSHVFGEFDVALSHFYGNTREPRFLPGRDALGQAVLIPLYERIHQTGLELQWTHDAWLWKLEAIRRAGQGDTFRALAAGFEYTFFGLAQTALDLGVVVEGYYDDRGETGTVIFQKDVLTALRLTLNDEQDTVVLAGVISDLDNGARFYSAEASRRLGDAWKLSLEARAWFDVPADDPLFSIRRDDYVQLRLAWFF